MRDTKNNSNWQKVLNLGVVVYLAAENKIMIIAELEKKMFCLHSVPNFFLPILHKGSPTHG